MIGLPDRAHALGRPFVATIRDYLHCKHLVIYRVCDGSFASKTLALDSRISTMQAPVSRLSTKGSELLSLEWAKTADGDWFKLDDAPLQHIHSWGVYVIWAAHVNARRPGQVLKIGSGNIGVRLAIERLDPELRLVAPISLFVTWAVVEDHHRHLPIVRYLNQHLRPFFQQFPVPLAETLEVNLPRLA